MPVAPTYPGVYVEEVPSGVRPISAVGTAVAAFVGWMPKGRMNHAVEVLSFADVEREFGGLHRDSDTSFALSQFFLNGGSRAWVVRVAAPGAGVATLAKATVTVPASAGGNAFVVTALSEGSWGNRLRVQILAADENRPGRFDLVVTLVDLSGTRPVIQQQERFPGLTATDAADPNYLPAAVNGRSRLIEVAPGGPAGFSGPKLTGLVSGKKPDVTTAPPRTITVAIGSESHAITLPPGNLTLEELADHLQSAIRTASGANPGFAQATVRVVRDTESLQIIPGMAAPVPVAVAAAGAATTAADLKLTAADATAQNGALEPVAGGLGGDGAPPGAAEIVGSEANGTGMFALEDTDFTILCLPSIANHTPGQLDALPNPNQYLTIVGNATMYCQRKRAIMLLDPPTTQASPQQVKAWVQGPAGSPIRDEYAAFYYPRVTITDPTRNSQDRSIGPSGTIAGLMARIDAARGVWKAPAGTEATLRGITKLDYLLTDPENGVLNPIAVNCLRQFPAYGMVSWGARTLEGSDASPSEYRYVPIRRLANFLESSISIGLKWVVFEPNDEPLWSQIRLNVGSFMNGLFRQGAFAGRSPRDAYLVRCDATTTTPTDQALGVVNVLVGFAPLRPAEFVILRIQQLAGEIQA